MIRERFAIKGLRFEQFHLKVGKNRVFGDLGVFGPKAFLGEKEHSGARNRFLGPKGEFWVKMGFWAPKAIH